MGNAIIPLLEPILSLLDRKGKMVGTCEAAVKQCGKSKRFCPVKRQHRELVCIR